MAPSMTPTKGPGPPPLPAPGAPAAPGAPPAVKSPMASPNARDGLLSSIRGAGQATLKKVSQSSAPPPLPASSPAASSGGLGGVDLNAALKSSLDRYRQFVQDEEDDIDDERDD